MKMKEKGGRAIKGNEKESKTEGESLRNGKGDRWIYCERD